MSAQFSNLALFEAEVSAALLRSAQLARQDAIKTNTGIIVERNGKVVRVSAAELQHEALTSKQSAE
ncbi:MAG TPA: hypothetical protein K8U84_08715 [Paenalcaligenes hominis]|uniref:Uncharacterized protein n=1 Tax=Paenalcaligenes hominis TaxID=643674 RepID=A0A9D3ABV9_9BURK|nr:hypothetical protein [Paenalcaligenes hominis]